MLQLKSCHVDTIKALFLLTEIV